MGKKGKIFLMWGFFCLTLSSWLYAQDYFPLEVNNIWIYRIQGGQVTCMDEIIDSVKIGYDTYYHFFGYRCEGDYYIRKDSLDRVSIYKDQADEVWYLLSAPAGLEYYIPDFKVTLESRTDTVTVPAGTFCSCLRFHFEAEDPDDHWIEWFAPDVGCVKRIYIAEGTYIFELKEYIPGTRSQMIDLMPGWNFISFNVMPQCRDVEEIFAPCSQTVNIVKAGDGSFYIPGEFNGIGDLNCLEGYKVHTNSQCSLLVIGVPILPSTPISLRSGWNWVAYLPISPWNTETALNTIESSLNICINNDGEFYIPGMINTMQKMYPGQGYKMHLSQPDTLIYESEILNNLNNKWRQIKVENF